MTNVSLTPPTDFHELITELLARFVVATGTEIDGCIETCLRDIAQVIGVDYAYIVRIFDDGQRWGITHEWCGVGIPSHLDDYHSVSMGTFDWLERKLMSGEVFWLNAVDELPPEATEVRTRLEAVGFKSTLQVPMRGPGGQVVGCIALSSIADEMHWSHADQGRLRLIGEVIANATQRAKVEQAMRAALAEVQQLTQQLKAENVYFQEELTSSLGFAEIVGESLSIRSTLRQLEHVAVTNASVLLLGETGTGKELLARAIHDRSPRKGRPLVKVNLAALSSSLIESELFGHVKGSFTGAIGDRVGRFQLADGGTLFLDEIGELSPELQTKLLRVLQEGELEQIGSGKTVKVDVRIVAATNRDLKAAMEQQKFRPDLYYRLAVFPIQVPPLRQRREDIPLLIWHFVSKKQGRLAKQIKSIPGDVMQALVQYDWPGNIRELENVIERAMILTSGDVLTMPAALMSESQRKPSDRSAVNYLEHDRAVIIATLESCRWKVKGLGNAAEQLGLKPSTLRYRMKTLGIKRPRSLGR